MLSRNCGSNSAQAYNSVVIMEQSAYLKRTLGFWALTAYGVGDILGAGIYALMGKVAGTAGHYSWLSFSVSLLVAAITALSYSELVTRFPKSGGESYYCEQGFRRKGIALMAGWLVFCAGTFSLAAISRAFAGYLQGMVPGLPAWPLILGFILLMGFINFWGIRESSMANILCTVIEASGLVFVIVVGVLFLRENPSQGNVAAHGVSIPWGQVLSAAALAFFAFIGFQDMVNIAEEVKEPERVFPRAIITALAFTGLIYIIISLVATAAVPPEVLSHSKAPLLEVVRASRGSSFDWMFTVIALFAVSNTGLLNFIMASRLIYGMSQQGLFPRWLDAVHRRRHTPHHAIAAVLAAALVLALSGTITYLAGTTSVLLLIVYVAVHVSLLLLKVRDRTKTSFNVPLAVPALGAITSLALIAFTEHGILLISLILVGIGVALVLLRRWRAA